MGSAFCNPIGVDQMIRITYQTTNGQWHETPTRVPSFLVSTVFTALYARVDVICVLRG